MKKYADPPSDRLLPGKPGSQRLRKVALAAALCGHLRAPPLHLSPQPNALCSIMRIHPLPPRLPCPRCLHSDLPPNAHHIKTLVLDLDDVLVHSDWTRGRCAQRSSPPPSLTRKGPLLCAEWSRGGRAGRAAGMAG